MIKKHIKLILVLAVLLIGLTGTGLYFAGFSFDFVYQLFGRMPTENELLEDIPEMDMEKYNRFLFSIDINTNSKGGNNEDIKETGAIELHKNISHMYNIDAKSIIPDYVPGKETWSDFNENKRYKNTEGWMTDAIQEEDAIKSLVNIINNRNSERIMLIDDSICTLSWRFDTDVDHLFQPLMSHHTENLDLNGYGRITAVFDPKTYEFQYFTIVLSANNSEQEGILLDSTFYWEVKNDDTKALSIPSDVVTQAYAKDTGVTMNGEYDPEVNPIAESLVEAYGGTAETTCDEIRSSLFWTMSGNNGTSSTMNYLKTKDVKTVYEENLATLSSIYGDPVEKTDEEVYFYNPKTRELTYIGKGEDWYAEIIITGSSGTSQGELRKSLITYKSRIEI